MPAADDPTSIGNVLIELKCCTQEDVDRALKITNNSQCLGELLVKTRVISQPQLEWALIYQKLQRRQISVEDAKAFGREQRTMLFTELGDVNSLMLAVADKITNGG
jgi:predicted ATPase